MVLKYIILSSIWTIVILILTLLPGQDIPNVPIFGIDKFVHMFMFGVLMFLVCKISKEPLISRSAYVVSSFILCISYGIIIEFIQQYIPGRSMSIYDIIANSVGVGLGFGAIQIQYKLKK